MAKSKAPKKVVEATVVASNIFTTIASPEVPASVEKAYDALIKAIDASEIPISRRTKAKNSLRLVVKRALKI